MKLDELDSVYTELFDKMIKEPFANYKTTNKTNKIRTNERNNDIGYLEKTLPLRRDEW